MLNNMNLSKRLHSKMLQGFCSIIYPKNGEIFYIGGAEVLPVPLEGEQEQKAINMIGTSMEQHGKSLLIEHNLRLVVYIAKKFDNTGVGVEDLISIGTIGLIRR